MFLILAVLMAVPATSMVYASEIVACKHDVSTYRVQAVKNPSASVKIRCYLTVTWDGSDCYVIARDHRNFSTPIRASYSTTYKGYPYVVSFGNQTWYFSL